MEKRDFIHSSRHFRKLIENDFIVKGSLTREDIASFVKILLNTSLCSNKFTKKSALFIVDALRKEEIMKLMDKTEKQNMDQETEEVLEQSIEKIRRAILEELAKKLNPNEYELVVKELSGPNSNHPIKTRISHVKGAYGREKIHRGTDTYYKHMKETLSDACERLIEAQKRGEETDHIIPIRAFDKNTGEMTAEKGEIKTIVDLIVEIEDNPDKSLDILRVLKENMEGAAFLESHGLMLEDIKPNNLGLYIGDNKKLNNKGVLFDLDGLNKIGVYQFGRWITPGFVPPELRESMYGEAPYQTLTSAKEMTYQFGRTLEQIAGLDDSNEAPYSTFNIDKKYMKEIAALAKKMMERNPDKRPTVREAILSLDKIIRKIKSSRNKKLKRSGSKTSGLNAIAP